MPLRPPLKGEEIYSPPAGLNEQPDPYQHLEYGPGIKQTFHSVSPRKKPKAPLQLRSAFFS